MSNPNVPFYQLPKTGTFSYQPFAVGSDYKFPDYFSSVFKPTEAQMQAKGTNTTNGGRDQPAFDYQSAGGALPGMPGNMQEYLNFFDALNESNLQKQIKAAQISQGLTEQQLASVYPFLSQAARRLPSVTYWLVRPMLISKSGYPQACKILLHLNNRRLALQPQVKLE